MGKRYKVGDEVVLFNSLGPSFEHDIVIGVVEVAEPVQGVQQSPGGTVREDLAAGRKAVRVRYQLAGHQGFLDGGSLFVDEDSCRRWYQKWLRA